MEDVLVLILLIFVFIVGSPLLLTGFIILLSLIKYCKSNKKMHDKDEWKGMQ